MATPTRVSGMMSGIDTESVVKAYVQNYIDKKTKIQQSQTKLSYKQEAWKGLNTKVYSLYNKVGTMRFTNSYNLKKTTVSDSTKATVSASSNAVVGTQSLKITQLAKAGYLTGAQLKKGTTESTTMADLGFTGDTEISVRIGSGEEKTISLSASTKVSDVVDALKDAGVNASFDASNRRIFVSAKNSGADNDFALTASSADGTKALNALGLLTTAAGDIKGYAANAAYAMATDGKSYYELDDEGNVKFGDDGKAIVRAGAVYDEAATKANIKTVLTTLANNYAENDALNLANSQLSRQVEYSEAYNNVEAVKAMTSEDGTINGTKLLDLVNAKADGALYVAEDGTTYKNVQENEDGTKTYYNESPDEEGAAKNVPADSELIVGIDDRINSYAKAIGLITTDSSEGEDGETVETDNTEAYDKFIADNTLLTGKYKDESHDDLYLLYTDEAHTIADSATAIANAKATIAANEETIADNNSYTAEHSYWDQKDYSAYINESTGKFDPDNADFNSLVNSITTKINFAYEVLNGESGISSDVNAGATRVTAQDAKIVLNGAEYTSSTSNFSINGINITALAETGDNEITINTTQDNQGIYDKVKEFLSQYNEVINEMQSLYNADSAKGYEPLTDDQKEEMSDKEIEKWEDKIKSSILRRDSSLSNLITKMTSAMSKPITINGTGYSLSSFGIQTLGYLNAAKNEQYAYHINGDEDDSASASKTDKLMAMINQDPDTVIEYMQKLSSQLYDAVGTEMKSTNLRTAYTVYNDKQMQKEYDNYTKSIKQWETKISEMEDRYYKKFSAMESSLAKMQSATSALSGMLGS